MKQLDEIMTAMRILLSNGEVRSLVDIKNKVGPKIQTAVKVAEGLWETLRGQIRWFFRPATACTLRRKDPTAVSSWGL